MTVDFSAIGLHTTDSLPQQKGNLGSADLGQDEFMQLLLAQLRNQDPLNPLENEAFVAQLAQFSTVSGITEISSGVKTLAGMFTANSGASAAQWIGRTVRTDAVAASLVTGVEVGAGGALSLTLEDGTTILASDVKSIS